MYRMDSWGSCNSAKVEHDDADSKHIIFEANVCHHQILSVAAMTGSVSGLVSNGNHANNGCNGSSATTAQRGCWTIGLINSKLKYLSAETFGYKVNANGKALKKKQVWVLEPSGDGDTIVMRSHLNKYIAVDQFGNVTCDQVTNYQLKFSDLLT